MVNYYQIKAFKKNYNIIGVHLGECMSEWTNIGVTL
jgi:hypothetical protein